MDTLELLRKRTAIATEQDQLSGLVFTGVLELARRELGDGKVSDLRARYGIPKRLIPFLKYPVGSFLRLSDELAQSLMQNGHGLTEALGLIGNAGTEAFFNSPVGQTLRMLNAGNVHRTGKAANLGYSAVYTYGARRYEPTGERAARMSYDVDFMGSGIQAGVLKYALGVVNGVALTVRPTEVRDDGLRFVLQLSW